MKIGYKVNLHYGEKDRIAVVDKIISKTRLNLTVKNSNSSTQQFLNVVIRPTQEKLQLQSTPYWTEKKQEKLEVKVETKTSSKNNSL